MIYGCDLGTLHEKLELGNLPAKEMKKVILFVCGLQMKKVILFVCGLQVGESSRRGSGGRNRRLGGDGERIVVRTCSRRFGRRPVVVVARKASQIRREGTTTFRLVLVFGDGD